MSNNLDRAEKACYDRLKPKTKGLKIEEAIDAMCAGKRVCHKDVDTPLAIAEDELCKCTNDGSEGLIYWKLDSLNISDSMWKGWEIVDD